MSQAKLLRVVDCGVYVGAVVDVIVGVVNDGVLMHWLCGYLSIPAGHPWNGREPSVDVHGGITWGGDARPRDWLPAVAPDSTWIGFDCSHVGDLVPGTSSSFRKDDVWRDETFVENELRKLAQQAARAQLLAGLPH